VAQSLEARFFASLALHRIELVIDVGANDGGYGRHLRQGGYRGPIVSFEPLPDAHAKLVQQARGDMSWTVAPAGALGEQAQEVDIHIAGNSKSSSLLTMLESHRQAAPQSVTIGTHRVQVRRLDDIELSPLRTANRMLLKVDTQGYEIPVLRGATNTLGRCAGVQLEMSLVPLYEGQALYRDLIGWLEARGFVLWALLPGFSDPTTGRMLQADGVFFRP
jgi:FkbM family methyltransferase